METLQECKARIAAQWGIYAAHVIEFRESGGAAAKKYNARKNRNRVRRERDAAMRSLGLKKVRGALGGTYWE